MKKFFTIIELIIVIVVLGILTAIVVPNISSTKDDAIKVAIKTDIESIQKAVDMYSLEKGHLPTTFKPTLGEGKAISLAELQPDYIRNLPKNENIKYWVDYTGKVWASEADSPHRYKNI